MIVRITSKFGEVSKIHPTPHTGIDLAFPEGSALQSIGEAVVEKVVDYGTQNIGKGVVLRLADGKQAIYGHMSKINVREGQILQEGDLIGLSGNTGHSTGPHLHFGLKDNGEFIDPTSLAENLVAASGSWWDKFIDRGSTVNNDYPTIKGYLYEKVIGDGIQYWLQDYIMALPILVGVSIGVWGLLSMVNKKLASWGVGFVFILGGLMLI